MGQSPITHKWMNLLACIMLRKPTTGGGIVEKSPLILFHNSPAKGKDTMHDKPNVYTKYIQNHVTRHSKTHTHVMCVNRRTAGGGGIVEKNQGALFHNSPTKMRDWQNDASNVCNVVSS